MKRVKDNDFSAYKYLSVGVMICAFFMFVLALLIYFPVDGGKQILDYTYKIAKPRDVAIALYCVGAPLFLMGLVTLIFKISKKVMAYIIIAYAMIAMMGVCVCTKFDFMLIFVLPALAAQLFIDKKITKFAEIGSIISFALAVVFAAFVFKSYPENQDMNNIRYYIALIKVLVPNIVILGLFSIIFNKLADKTTNMQTVNMEQAKTIDNRGEIMNTLIKSSLDLFVATKVTDLDDAIRTTCIDVCSNFLENPSETIRVYIGKSFDGSFKCYGAKLENGTFEMIPAI